MQPSTLAQLSEYDKRAREYESVKLNYELSLKKMNQINLALTEQNTDVQKKLQVGLLKHDIDMISLVQIIEVKQAELDQRLQRLTEVQPALADRFQCLLLENSK